MDQIDISTAAILKLSLAWAAVYLVAPILKVVRDLILLWVIERWILNDRLKHHISICESARWDLVNKYNLKRSVGFSSGGEKLYKLDGKEVPKEEYEKYDTSFIALSERFNRLDSKINFKHNLICSLTTHYKTEKFESPIPFLREEAYENRASKNA